MEEKNKELNKNIDTSNIFDDFVDDSSLIDEVNKIKNERNRDLFYYISKAWYVFQILFWTGFVVLIILFSYIYIQNNKTISNSNILDPFCSIFLGDIEKEDPFCSSISYLKWNYSNKLENIKTTQSNDILNILQKLYEVENFTKSKNVLFLADKSENKLKILNILEEFDNIKNEFNKVDKQKIQCNSLSIDWKNSILSMNCIAYSAWFEKWLRWVDGSNTDWLKGTSISEANSFINFIDKRSNIFTLIDRQKVFKSENTLWEKTDFTNMTKFSLKLKYNLK